MNSRLYYPAYMYIFEHFNGKRDLMIINSTAQSVLSSLQENKKEEEEKIKVWKEVFDLFDANKDGHISTDELGVVLRGLDLNPTEKEVKEIATQLDKNKNGIIEFNEFVALMKNKQRSREEEKDDMIRAFRIVDRDDNKYIDKFELKRLMTKFGEVLSEEEVDSMIKVADLNRDGKIDYNEFVKFLLQPCL